MYVWVPLAKPKRRREKGMVEEEVSDLQVSGWAGAWVPAYCVFMRCAIENACCAAIQ